MPGACHSRAQLVASAPCSASNLARVLADYVRYFNGPNPTIGAALGFGCGDR